MLDMHASIEMEVTVVVRFAKGEYVQTYISSPS